jgi:hypothetical protein
MTPCSRSCCWTPHACAKARTCACHWDERKPSSRTNGTNTYSDPTANQAVRNVMKEGRPR